MPNFSQKKRNTLGINPDGRMNALIDIVRGKRKFETVMSELKASDELFLKADLETKHGVIGQFLEHKGSKFSPILIADKIIAELQSKGETIETSDWINTSNTQGDNVLSWATKHKAIKKIFIPELWINRIEEMQGLYDLVPDEGKKQISNFTEIRRRAISLSKNPPVIDNSLTKEKLLKPDNDGCVLLEDYRVWGQWDKVVLSLSKKNPSGSTSKSFSKSANGQTLTKQDLLKESPNGKPYIIIAAEAGKLADVVYHLDTIDDTPSRDELIKAGLSPYLDEANADFNAVAISGDNKRLMTMAKSGIVDIDNTKDVQQQTPVMLCANAENDEGVVGLLDEGANPLWKAGNKNSITLLWLCAKNTSLPTVRRVIKAIKENLEDDPFKILGALTIVNSSKTASQIAEEQEKLDVSKIIEKEVDRAIVNILHVAKENDECLVEPLIDGKSVLDVLTSLDRLKSIFTVSNWQGNPKGMHEIAGQIPENILEKQLVDDENQPMYSRILSSVNAATLKL